jgi:hypothetical protein
MLSQVFQLTLGPVLYKKKFRIRKTGSNQGCGTGFALILVDGFGSRYRYKNCEVNFKKTNFEEKIRALEQL